MSFTDLAYGGSQAIQQLLLQRELEKAGVSPIQLAQAKLANEQRIQNRADQEMQLRRLEYEQNQARMAANDQSLAQQRLAGEGEKAAETIPGNSILSPTDTGAGKIEAAGLGGLLTRNTTLPSTQMTGTDLGRLTTRSVPSDNEVQSLTKLPTEKQATTAQAAKDREQAHADAMTNAAASRAMTAAAQESTNAFRDATLKQGQQRINQGQERIDKGPTERKQWVQRDGQLVYDVPQFGDTKPPNATTDNRLVSAQAVVQTGNDIIRELSDPKVAAMLGPVMSRYNSMADFIGNPPPEFAHLAGQIESYSLANMGVHGMRANSGAEAIKGTLGLGRHTPESIISTVQGLNGFANHLMENEGRSAGASGGPKVGDVKTFPNGKKGRWDGTGWELVQ